MSYLLDTCVLSEYTRKHPALQVIEWLDAQDEAQLFVSQLSIAELERGVIKLRAKDAAQARRLAQWLARLTQRFAPRTLQLDAPTLRIWAQLCADADVAGQRIAALDALLMATAQRHGLSIVTRNVADFARYPRLLDPWAEPS